MAKLVKKSKTILVGDAKNHEEVSVLTYLAGMQSEDIMIDQLQNIYGNVSKLDDDADKTMPEEFRNELEAAAETDDYPDNLVEIFEESWDQIVADLENSAAIQESLKQSKEDAKAEKAKAKDEAEAAKAEQEAAVNEMADDVGRSAVAVAAASNVAKIDSNILKGLPEGLKVDASNGVVTIPSGLSLSDKVAALQVSLGSENMTQKVNSAVSWLTGDLINSLKDENGDTFEAVITKSGMLETFGVSMNALYKKARTALRYDNAMRSKCGNLSYTHFVEATVKLPDAELDAKSMQSDIDKLLVKVNKGVKKENPDGKKVTVIPGAQGAIRPEVQAIRAKYNGDPEPKRKLGAIIVSVNDDGLPCVEYSEELNADQIASLNTMGALVISQKNRDVTQHEGGTTEIEWIDPDSIISEPAQNSEDAEEEEEDEGDDD